MIVVASVSPIPGTVLSRWYSARRLTRSLNRFSSASICCPSAWLTARLVDDHTRQFVPIRLKRRRNLRELVWQAFLVHDPVVVVADDYHAVVRMQVYATIVHVGLRRVKVRFGN